MSGVSCGAILLYISNRETANFGVDLLYRGPPPKVVTGVLLYRTLRVRNIYGDAKICRRYTILKCRPAAGEPDSKVRSNLS
jgi:hypothetical protein